VADLLNNQYANKQVNLFDLLLLVVLWLEVRGREARQKKADQRRSQVVVGGCWGARGRVERLWGGLGLIPALRSGEGEGRLVVFW
jgi:hypothetical protein